MKRRVTCVIECVIENAYESDEGRDLIAAPELSVSARFTFAGVPDSLFRLEREVAELQHISTRIAATSVSSVSSEQHRHWYVAVVMAE